MALLRSAASRRLLLALPSLSAGPSVTLRSRLSTLSTSHGRPLLRTATPITASKTLSRVRWQTTGDRKLVDQIDTKREAEIQKGRLDPHPELVSASSSTHPVMGEIGAAPGQRGQEEDDTEMLAGIKSDIQTIRDTFSLEGVPREAYYVGMAGVLPYLATSLSTVYCAWEINHASETGTGLLMNEKTAELLLHVIEPLQIGYGATIISFLGAIHWGLEWAGYGGYHGYNRYSIGVIATALAWPTILLPAEYALISQFLIFNFLYYTDSRATRNGWAPPWYGVYRFVLTFVVGSAIVVSLIGRGQIADRIEKQPGPADRIRALREAQSEQVVEEEEARRRFLADKDEEEENEDEEGGDGEEED